MGKLDWVEQFWEKLKGWVGGGTLSSSNKKFWKVNELDTCFVCKL